MNKNSAEFPLGLACETVGWAFIKAEGEEGVMQSLLHVTVTESSSHTLCDVV